jgi:hypothetical protein
MWRLGVLTVEHVIEWPTGAYDAAGAHP